MNVDQSAHEIFCVSPVTSQMYILHYFDALLTKVYLIYNFLVQLEEVAVHVYIIKEIEITAKTKYDSFVYIAILERVKFCNGMITGNGNNDR
ncbi:hypothetical protein P5673_020575, partial [Acropora cervicornis]